MKTINMENMKEEYKKLDAKLAGKLQTGELASKLQADEVMQYISQRHHVQVSDVLVCFTMQADGECRLADRHPVELEENEIQIIHDLIRMYHR